MTSFPMRLLQQFRSWLTLCNLRKIVKSFGCSGGQILTAGASFFLFAKWRKEIKNVLYFPLVLGIIEVT